MLTDVAVAAARALALPQRVPQPPPHRCHRCHQRGGGRRRAALRRCCAAASAAATDMDLCIGQMAMREAVDGTVVIRIEGRWSSTENENGHRAVCTGCVRAHSHELVVPLQHFGCMSRSTCCGVQPSTATIQPGVQQVYNQSTTSAHRCRSHRSCVPRAVAVGDGWRGGWSADR